MSDFLVAEFVRLLWLLQSECVSKFATEEVMNLPSEREGNINIYWGSVRYYEL